MFSHYRVKKMWSSYFVFAEAIGKLFRCFIIFCLLDWFSGVAELFPLGIFAGANEPLNFLLFLPFWLLSCFRNMLLVFVRVADSWATLDMLWMSYPTWQFRSCTYFKIFLKSFWFLIYIRIIQITDIIWNKN